MHHSARRMRDRSRTVTLILFPRPVDRRPRWWERVLERLRYGRSLEGAAKAWQETRVPRRATRH
jgi:hypothetical protein